MVIASSLLEVKSLSWKQSFLRPNPIFRHGRSSNIAVAAKKEEACFSTKVAATATFNSDGGRCSAAAAATKAKFSITKCYSMKHQQKQQSLYWWWSSSSSSSSMDDEKEEIAQAKIPLEVVAAAADVILHVLKVLRKPAIVAVFLGALLMYHPYNLAMAASGGRMGGSSFSSRRSSSSKSSSSSGSSGATLFIISWLFTSSPSPSYPSSDNEKPNSYTSSYTSSTSYSSSLSDSSSALSFWIFFSVILAFFVAFFVGMNYLTAESNRKSVLKLQIGLLGLGRSIQSDLNKIAEVADTSTPEGLSYILKETIMALLRHPDYCISSYSSVDVKWSMEDCEKHFNQLSLEERSKLDEETLVNVNNIKRQSAAVQRASDFSNDCIVITILVAAEGIHKLPTINSSDDLKEALLKLGSFPSYTTLAVEVLWTPQNEDDTLSKQELLEDYPLLKPL